MGSPVRLKATAPILPAAFAKTSARRHTRPGRTLAFPGGPRARRAAIVLQERHCDIIGDIGHGRAPDLIDQAASVFTRGNLAGAGLVETAACKSCTSLSRYSFAMINALIVLRRFPSHIAMA